MFETQQRDDRQTLVDTYGSFAFPLELPPPRANAKPVTRITEVMSPNKPVMREGKDRITLKVRRRQTRGWFGRVGFSIHFIAELSPEARNAVNKYGFGKVILFEKNLKNKLFTANPIKLVFRFLILVFTRSRWQIRVNDLVQGRTIASKDILEMLETEEEIKKATRTFADILRTAAWFGGEELIEL